MSEINFSKESFFSCIIAYIRNPHYINRKVNCVSNVKCGKIKAENDCLRQIFEACKSESEILNIFSTGKINFEKIEPDDLFEHIKQQEDIHNKEHVIFVSLDKIIPRDTNKFSACHQFTIMGKMR
jgi:hypothetical protein